MLSTQRLSTARIATVLQGQKSHQSNAMFRLRRVRPNPSIERDVQGLSPLAAPHVKRWAAAMSGAYFGSRLSTLVPRRRVLAAHSTLDKQSLRVGLAAIGAPGTFRDFCFQHRARRERVAAKVARPAPPCSIEP